MSNEELATLIQSGRDDLLLTLWEQVEHFVYQQAHRWLRAWKGRGGAMFEDFCQSGFLGFLTAVRTYDESRGAAFITWLGTCLKNPFMEAVGYRTTRQQNDPLNSASSLDEPLDSDTEGLTFGDTIADPAEYIEDTEHRVFIAELHDELERALSRLPEEQSSTLRQRFYNDMSYQQVADQTGATPDAARQWEMNGLKQLRRPSKEHARLRAFLDERTPFYNVHGVHSLEWAVVKRERICEGATAKSFPYFFP